jgi:hypothetical protein
MSPIHFATPMFLWALALLPLVYLLLERRS